MHDNLPKWHCFLHGNVHWISPYARCLCITNMKCVSVGKVTRVAAIVKEFFPNSFVCFNVSAALLGKKTAGGKG